MRKIVVARNAKMLSLEHMTESNSDTTHAASNAVAEPGVRGKMIAADGDGDTLRLFFCGAECAARPSVFSLADDEVLQDKMIDPGTGEIFAAREILVDGQIIWNATFGGVIFCQAFVFNSLESVFLHLRKSADAAWKDMHEGGN